MGRLTCKYEELSALRDLCTFDKNNECIDCKSCAACCEEESVNDCAFCPIQDAFDKLAEYEDAEEKGLLLRLPCPIGTTVFVVVEEYEEMYEPDSTYFEIYSESFHPYMLDDIGKYVFLTEEEAEAALKKKQEGEE